MESARERNRAGYIALAMLGVFLLLGCTRYMCSSVSVSSNVNGKELPICSVETDEPEVSLTFDVAWNSEDLDAIIEILEREGVRASFFVTGEWIGKHPEQLQELAEAGHDVGNHSQNHKNMTLLSAQEQKLELEQVREQAERLTGRKMDLFRPPYGNYDDSLIRQAEELGYATVNWNIDSQDWKDYGENEILKAVLQNEELKNGSIILLHAGTRYLAGILDDLIGGLRKLGYHPVPVSELILREDFYMDVTGRQKRNGS